MHITRLRLLGFKSFVESADLVIERGLTGVVGPNGCGKSNLLEALRWVMGETSYKNMRGSNMEDVIFSGTNMRPARNIAEVSINLDNRDRKAHPSFNDDDNLEITRRIERDAGSQYSINGKPVRARDVQLLFADASTGAHSPALVQQGRIGEIVSAKPAQRRFILEEAAGITGLHSRRHEAEIKLRGAENNLERLLDIIGQMQTRLSSLKRQERQVKRYRQISRDIEQLTILRHYSDWLGFQQIVHQSEQQHQQSLESVGEKTRSEAQIRQLQIEAANQLPKLREREMVTAAIVQRLNIESDHLEREQQAAQKRKNELISRCAQIDADLGREQKNHQDNEQRLMILGADLSELEQSTKGQSETSKQAALAAQKTAKALSHVQQQHLALAADYAEQKAIRSALQRQHQEKDHSLAMLHRESQQLDIEQTSIQTELSQIADFDELNRLIVDQSKELAALETRLFEFEYQIDQARTEENKKLHAEMEERTRLASMSAQIDTLENLLHTPNEGAEHPVHNEIEVTPGYETALGAALGDDLEASLNDKTNLYWRGFDTQDKTPALPHNCIPLHQLVTAPKALSRRLLMTGIVERTKGDHLQPLLLPGQRLVSLEGDLWRWDGFTARADAPTNAARRLTEKNRLEQLHGKFKTLHLAHESAEKIMLQAKEKRTALETERQEFQKSHREIRSELEKQQDILNRSERAAAVLKTRQDVLLATKDQMLERRVADQQKLEKLTTELAQLSDLTSLENEVEQHVQAINQHQTRYHEAQTFLIGQQQAEQNRQHRLTDLNTEISRTKSHIAQGFKQVITLEKRRKVDGTELSELDNLPDQTSARRQALNSELTKACEQRKQAADQLQQGENSLREIDISLQGKQLQATKARENRAGCEARLEAARTRLVEQIELIKAELDCTPDDCLEKAGLAQGHELPKRHDLERHLEKASTDRERLGSVNLRAEEEASELAQQVEEMSLEHKDLVDAISALRTAISGLNKEGRRRLMSAFTEINTHFESLFTSLFGGGKARLELIESDDPLQAGLEIIASPPGKKPQVLTLLSGGEKALTALSLIFAVFLTNPAPICVLDEVDAPLDDANVERFCKLLDEMTKKTDTRFLVITHHPTTMTHMDRLFGVTMAEKGISQMVSVDLTTAESFRETA